MSNSLGIHGDRAVAKEVTKVASQQVGFILIGDSNTIRNGNGWDEGFQHGLSACGFAMKATSIISPNMSSAWGYKYQLSNAVRDGYTGAPDELAIYSESFAANTGTELAYWFVGDGVTSAKNVEGMSFAANCPINVNANLKFRFHWGSFTTGSGDFKAGIRYNESPYTALGNTGVISTNTGAYGMHVQELTLAAAARNKILAAGFDVPTIAHAHGPMFALGIQAVNTDITAGYRFQSFGLGGVSALGMAKQLQNQSDTFLTYIFNDMRSQMIADQGTASFVIMINEGANDLHASIAENPGGGWESVGPTGGLESSTAEGYIDNIRAIIERLMEIWTLNGWSTSEMHWIIMPTHPISNPDHALLSAYRAAAPDLIDLYDNVLIANLEEMIGFDFIDANGWSTSADRYHLQIAGYYGASRAVFRALEEYAGQTVIDQATGTPILA